MKQKIHFSECSINNFKIFLYTAIAYMSLHSIRTGWSYIKADFQYESQLPAYFIGTLDLFFLISYAIGLFINGSLGDKIDLKFFLIIGLLGTTFSIMLFSIYGFISYYSPILILISFILNGFFQSIVNFKIKFLQLIVNFLFMLIKTYKKGMAIFYKYFKFRI